MSRHRKPYYVQQKVSIPATLLARFSRFHWDAAKNKVQYGAISEVVTNLLSDYVNRMENPPLVPDQEPVKEKVS
jgi:hypothetical protein